MNQLKSLGFHVLYFPYASLIEAFRKVGVNADFDESTSEKEFQRKLNRWRATSKKAKRTVAAELIAKQQRDIDDFFAALASTAARCIEKIIVVPLHGREIECSSVGEAIALLTSYESTHIQGPVYKYEIHVRYNNGDKIMAEFAEKSAAVEFLRRYD